jgi:hypothetical protein
VPIPYAEAGTIIHYFGKTIIDLVAEKRKYCGEPHKFLNIFSNKECISLLLCE